MRIFHDNTKDDHSYTKGRQPPQRLQPRFRQLSSDVPRHRFPLCTAAQKRYADTIGYSNTVVSRACAEVWLQSKNADKDTDCILISVLIWWRRRELNPCPKISPCEFLRVHSVLYIPSVSRRQKGCWPWYPLMCVYGRGTPWTHGPLIDAYIRSVVLPD